MANYAVSNEGKTAESKQAGDVCLYSAWKAYSCGHSIVFKVLETGAYQPADGIALCATNDKSATLCRHSSLFISSSGLIFTYIFSYHKS